MSILSEALEAGLRRTEVRPKYAVDWDGTCVGDAWPEMGEWLPGAIEALHALCDSGRVVIHSCRVAPFDMDMVTPRDPQPEVDAIRFMLDEQGLQAIEVWTRPYKPPALVYIDNRARRYLGHKRSWKVLMEQLALAGELGEEVPA